MGKTGALNCFKGMPEKRGAVRLLVGWGEMRGYPFTHCSCKLTVNLRSLHAIDRNMAVSVGSDFFPDSEELTANV